MKLPLVTSIVVFLMSFHAVGVEVKDDQHEYERTDLAIKADEKFWVLIHGEDYQSFDTTVTKLNIAQSHDPFDVYSHAHIGWANFWAVAEGIGLGIAQGANALQYLINAESAFSRAAELAPNEPRILGFLGYTRLTLGNATQDINMLAQGQMDVARSIELWPEWAYFGAAYGLDAQAPYGSPQFDQALNYYWSNVDVCANTAVDRQHPDFTPYMYQQTLKGPDRACWDSWIAPYNTEGFFLVMGDALVKAGQTDVALIIYNNAKLQEHYRSWPFRHLLESRIKNINENVDNFRQPTLAYRPADPEKTLLANTSVSCAICHRGNADKNYERPDWVGEDANEYLVPFKQGDVVDYKSLRDYFFTN